MECSVYALASSAKEYIYVGLSEDVERRINEHQRGKERTTRAYRPFEVLLIEVLPNRTEARKREKFLKSGAGKEFLKELRERKRISAPTQVAELVDALVSNTSDASRAGSSPALGTDGSDDRAIR